MTKILFRPVRETPVLVLDVLLGAVLSTAMVLLVSLPPGGPGDWHEGPLGDSPVARTLVALTMTIPVVWRRVSPVGVSAALVVGAGLNAVLVGDLVRCGPALPALFLTTYAAGRTRALTVAAGAVTLCGGSGVLQTFSDPNLGPSMGPVLVALCAVFAGIGWLVAARQADVAALRESNRALRRQRQRNADLAVASDRERISVGLEEALHERLAGISSAADRGREGDLAAALVEVEHLGRAALGQMREVVGQLRNAEQEPGPQPVLAHLSALLAEASADSRLTMDPLPESLPAGLELSAYRIVEHVVTAMEEEPEAPLVVHVGFADGALTLRVLGPAVDDEARERALAGMRQRAALHGGTAELARVFGGLEVLVHLPTGA